MKPIVLLAAALAGTVSNQAQNRLTGKVMDASVRASYKLESYSKAGE
jgi:hypothetical protein